MTDLSAPAASAPPFRTVDGNPPPPGLEAGLHPLPDGARLRWVTALPTGPARGTVLILQGRNETLEKYFETMGDLLAEGFAVASFDWRGQGASGRSTPIASVGHITSIDQLAQDLEHVLHHLVRGRCPGPVAILAHSMGGLVALHAMEAIEHSVERLVLSAPLVRIPGSPAARRLIAATCALLHWTGLGILPVRRAALPGADPQRSDLSSDPVRLRRNAALARASGDWAVSGLSASWLRAVLRGCGRLERSDTIARMSVPTLVLTAGADSVVSPQASSHLAWRMRVGHGITVPGARHELLQEADRFRAPAMAAAIAFIEEALPRRLEAPPLDVAELAQTLETALG
ncbi:alpha/beta fold hydrolase [Aureimonas sp. AU4]|uniref:alpha/beta fold hydrolase n=1 Tax=Aureimonas sp. AU4 TaxID=1638163 RepID=UPI0007862CF1|nr:alpha/beta hydrolase [Aureimonas sp. AU4]